MRNGVQREVAGAGPDLVLVHGWGLNGRVWESVARTLAARCRVIRIDLPGFGRSPWEGSDSLEGLAERVAAAVPQDAIWIGWSLGGLVTLQAVLGGAAIRRVALVGSTPRFVQDSDWPWAMARSVCDGFADALEADFQGTVQRFLALQCRGSERGRDELRYLRELLIDSGVPDPRALRWGLDVLRGSDLRSQLERVGCPALVIHGDRDTLVPLRSAELMAERLPSGRLEIVRGAGHAPFLSHPGEFCQSVEAFIADG